MGCCGAVVFGTREGIMGTRGRGAGFGVCFLGRVLDVIECSAEGRLGGVLRAFCSLVLAFFFFLLLGHGDKLIAGH